MPPEVRGVRRFWNTLCGAGGGKGGAWAGDERAEEEVRGRLVLGTCAHPAALSCPSAGPGGGRPLLLPQRGGECWAAWCREGLPLTGFQVRASCLERVVGVGRAGRGVWTWACLHRV